MNKTELIEHIAKNADLSKAAATRALEAALGACSPHGLDMNSALESAPGVKDHTLVREAIRMIKARRKTTP